MIGRHGGSSRDDINFNNGIINNPCVRSHRVVINFERRTSVAATAVAVPRVAMLSIVGLHLYQRWISLVRKGQSTTGATDGATIARKQSANTQIGPIVDILANTGHWDMSSRPMESIITPYWTAAVPRLIERVDRAILCLLVFWIDYGY